jgi:uncharacterized protein (DUF362 family)
VDEEKKIITPDLSRRRFIISGGISLVSTILLPSCGGSKSKSSGSSASDDDDDNDNDNDLSPDDDSADDDTGGGQNPAEVLFSADSAGTPREAVRMLLQSLDWSWLLPGDSVFIKVACNSGNRHPAVVSPNAVWAVVTELFARGAGQVIVGDQAGVSSVRSAAGNRHYGATRTLMQNNDLLAAIDAAGAEPYFFDEQDYDSGYFAATVDFPQSHWLNPPRVPEIIRQVDHLIYLPRLSSHLIAGYTHGHKNAIGWLRDDSRYELHYKADTFHEKYVEINYCREIRERLRFTLTLAEQLLLDSGPDSGTITPADPWLVIASQHLANHDALSVAALAYIDDRTPPSGAGLLSPYGANSDFYNHSFILSLPLMSGIPWSNDVPGPYTHLKIHDYQRGIANDRSLQRAYQILGGIPQAIDVRLLGETPAPEFLEFLQGFNSGIFQIKAKG